MPAPVSASAEKPNRLIPRPATSPVPRAPRPAKTPPTANSSTMSHCALASRPSVLSISPSASTAAQASVPATMLWRWRASASSRASTRPAGRDGLLTRTAQSQPEPDGPPAPPPPTNSGSTDNGRQVHLDLSKNIETNLPTVRHWQHGTASVVDAVGPAAPQPAASVVASNELHAFCRVRGDDRRCDAAAKSSSSSGQSPDRSRPEAARRPPRGRCKSVIFGLSRGPEPKPIRYIRSVGMRRHRSYLCRESPQQRPIVTNTSASIGL